MLRPFRVYTMLQWLLGLMVTIIIGVGGLIAASLRQLGEKKRDVPRETRKRGGSDTGKIETNGERLWQAGLDTGS